jgi:ubiquinol-cytochrome c reductase cytochrome c1 subunit
MIYKKYDTLLDKAYK